MKILVAAHQGMVGGALLRVLQSAEHRVVGRSRLDVDMRDPAAVEAMFEDIRPEHVYVAAARVGGIYANNTYPADFIYDNLMIAANMVHAAHKFKTQRLLFLGSSCIYPRLADQPMAEEALLTGALEPTNEPYAVSKIAGIKLCESFNRQHGTDFRALMPTNLYGPGDNFSVENSHVLPALIRRFHEAKLVEAPEIVVWGTGEARREFLHVDDLAAACKFVMSLDYDAWASVTKPMQGFLNVGAGTDVTIRELAEKVAAAVGYAGKIVFDASKPDGAPRKLLDVSRLQALGWQHRIDLEYGIKQTYDWFRAQTKVRGI